MVLRMPRPTTRENSSFLQFRCRVPADIAEVARGKLVLVELPAVSSEAPVTVSATAGAFIKFSLRTRDPNVAKVRSAAANTQVSQQFSAWRSGPASLSQRQLVGLSGEVYRLLVEKFGENPGDPENWAAFKAFNRAAKEGRLLNVPLFDTSRLPVPRDAYGAFGKDLTAGVNALPATGEPIEALERRFGWLTNWVLQKHGLAIDPETRARLLAQVEQAATDARWALKRNASGDYSPDPKASRFPPIAVGSVSPAVSLDGLFERWATETQPSASTRTTWTSNLRFLKEHLGSKADDIRRITSDDIVAWKDAAVARGRKAKTINDSYLGAAKALFNYAVSNKLLTDNPADGVRVVARSRAGTTKQPYSDEEVARLLALADKETDPARRWLPWLLAGTGARVGEIVQLWGSRIKEVEGQWVMVIAPAEDGGSLKNEGSERTVPLHPALVEAGFLDFVRERGQGPLFYRRSSGKASKRHASKGVSNRLSSWIRGAGFKDPRKAPAHAFRHWFKSSASRRGVADSMADALQGHAAASVAARYRHFDVKDMAAAIAKIPLPPKD
ncbi:hypothetical protein EJC49_04645 [Aquibium carbonis]|uniref:Site-specific recombinase XerD n=1 Tax=Aquibium carbonis TaxID=2495581 RepID=A0A429Z1A4_9HYPH|nr:tyrosine-type recombinase/integrase [Aquibium carbonis]RST87516.1 hypothetical protein EJC49_04645 [Aquibium carbonis]